MKDGFEIRIRQVLQQEAADVQPSGDMILNIRREADRRKKEKNDMTFKMKRMVALLAALCLITVTCYAAVEISTYESHSGQEYTKYADLALVEADVGFAFNRVEEFSNGFRFERGGTNISSAMDENGNVIGEEVKGANVLYSSADHKQVMLFVKPQVFYEADRQMMETGYNSDTYKFVPDDYQLTDEDKRMMDAGDFFVSYGSDEVEVVQEESYRWEDGNLVYSLMAFDCRLGEEILAAMAREIMG